MFAEPQGALIRPEDLSDKADPKVLYFRSYLLIRAAVGFIGVVLPLLFIIGEAFIGAGVHVRGSISAYYHSPMRDVFVGGLVVISFLLAMYMAGQKSRADWTLSTVAGISLLFVVVFPTGRPNIKDGAPLCGSDPEPAGCSTVQQQFGETLVATVHFVAAGGFILSLATICFYWAWLEAKHRLSLTEQGGQEVHFRDLRSERSLVQVGCGTVIVLAVVWVGVGGLLDADIWELTPLYVGEVVFVWAFGVAWPFASWDLWKELIPGVVPAAEQTA